MEETKLDKLARLSDTATSKGSRCSRCSREARVRYPWEAVRANQSSSTEAKVERVMSDPETIYNWHRLDDRITTSGQPTEPQLADIHALGVHHVINLGLHTHEKALPDEAASVSRLGMTYIHIPVDFQNPTDQDFDRFCSAMEQLKEVPVHVHCIANYRVSAFFYRYRRDVLGMNEVQARADMEQIWHPERAWATFIER